MSGFQNEDFHRGSFAQMVKRNLKLWGLFFLSAIIIGALLETGSFLIFRIKGIKRYDYPGPVTNFYHPYLGWTHPPNTAIDTSSKCSGETAILTDKDGYSITPYASFDEPALTIVVLGGSTMFGQGSTTNKTTVPSYLEKIIIERTGMKAEVYNLAQDGYQSFQQMLMLHKFLNEKEVDLVLSIGGRNDVSNAAFHQDVRSASLDDYVYSVMAFVRRVEKGAFVIAGLAPIVRSRSYTVDLLFRIVEKLRGVPVPGLFRTSEPRKGNFDNIEERGRITNMNFAVMNTIAKENGSEFVMLLQPIIYMRENLTESEIDCIQKGEDIREYEKEYIRRFYNHFRARPKSYVFHDISYCLNEAGNTYVDQSHYNDKGAFLVAEEVFKKIEPILDRIARRKNLTFDNESATENVRPLGM